MARRTLAPRGEAIRLARSWRTRLPLRVDPAGEVLLPGQDARLAPITFDTWLPRAEGDGAARHVARGAAGLPG